MNILGIIFSNFGFLDGVICLFGVLNLGIYGAAYGFTDRIYRHFNPQDRLSRLHEVSRRLLTSVTAAPLQPLRADALLEVRAKANLWYAVFCNITSLFPLMGMFGTVISLIPMVELIGSEAGGAFFTALTSTFWGILWAMLCKALDPFLSTRLEDNEKHMEYIFNPTLTRPEEEHP